jgi:hypothetical protein
MGYLVNLMMSRPHKGRSAAQYILSSESPEGHKQRAIVGDGYAFIYSSQGQNIYVKLNELPWKQKKAWWYNPRDGKVSKIDSIPAHGNHTFNPPGSAGGDNDWVLVIDDASKDYLMPGSKKKSNLQ